MPPVINPITATAPSGAAVMAADEHLLLAIPAAEVGGTPEMGG
jgi:hypothetical protein